MVEAQMTNILDRAVSMSEQDRNEYITDFVNKHGLKETFQIVKNIVKQFLGMKVTAQMYQGFRGNNSESKGPMAVRNTEQYPAEVPAESTGSGKLYSLLNKAGDWSVLLTFFLMWAAVSTSDYYTLVQKQPNSAAEIKAFLIASGAAFMTWLFKFLASKVKPGKR
jgi:hypothetical protein